MTTLTLRKLKPTDRKLDATKTATDRRLQWVPAPRGETQYLGILIVQQKKEHTTYQVDEGDADGMPGRAYLLAKQHQLNRSGRPVTDASEVYRVYLGVDPKTVHCNCSGFGRHGHCKHTDAILSLLTPSEADTPHIVSAGVQTEQPTADPSPFGGPVGQCNRCDGRGQVFDADCGYMPCESCQEAQ